MATKHAQGFVLRRFMHVGMTDISTCMKQGMVDEINDFTQVRNVIDPIGTIRVHSIEVFYKNVYAIFFCHGKQLFIKCLILNKSFFLGKTFYLAKMNNNFVNPEYTAAFDTTDRGIAKLSIIFGNRCTQM